MYSSGKSDTGAYSLDFDAKNYTVKTATLDGATVTYRAYENIVYVRNPVDVKYERLNFYVPDGYYSGATIGGYTADTALAVPTILATTLSNRGCSIDFELPWNRPHSGDYDLDELFAWIGDISRK
jgi:hypothetical protein